MKRNASWSETRSLGEELAENRSRESRQKPGAAGRDLTQEAGTRDSRTPRASSKSSGAEASPAARASRRA